MTTQETIARQGFLLSRPAKRRPILLALLALGLVAVFAASLAAGSARIPIDQVIRILFGGEGDKATWSVIIWQFRLPKAITALLAGAALGVAGLHMQTLFRNPLADPFVLGISSGASLGVALVVLGTGSGIAGASMTAGMQGLSALGVVVAASIGAGVVLAIILLASRRVNTMTLLILGLMMGYAVNGFVSILLHFSIAERVHLYVAWTFGSFAGVSWDELTVLAPVVIAALVVSGALVKPLNALLLGEGYARTMGVPMKRTRTALIGASALLAGAVTAFCGPIGFLGIAVPHLCRAILRTSDHRWLIPATMVTGGLLAILADLIAQLPGSNALLPLNAITALFGAPVVAWVILKRKQ